MLTNEQLVLIANSEVVASSVTLAEVQELAKMAHAHRQRAEALEEAIGHLKALESAADCLAS